MSIGYADRVDTFPLWLLVAVFVGAASVIWVAGIQLSKTTDVLDARLHLGSALGGLIVLALATNLPEIAITVSAAVSGNVSVAVGNILGGIAIQTVVLVALDFFGKRGQGVRPLTYRASSLALVVEALLVVAVLTLVVAGSQLPEGLILARLTPDVVLIAVLWIIGLILVQRAGHHLPWQHGGHAPEASPHHGGHRRHKPEAPHRDYSTVKASLIFAMAAVATLAAGVVLERSGEVAAKQIGLGGVLFGATVLAAATSLPELSTGLQAVKQGDDNLAMSDIFGGNAFLPVLFLVATVLSGKAVLPAAQASDIYLTALAALLTLIYVAGLLFRPARRIAGMGVDSLIVLIVYAVGVAGLFAIG